MVAGPESPPSLPPPPDEPEQAASVVTAARPAATTKAFPLVKLCVRITIFSWGWRGLGETVQGGDETSCVVPDDPGGELGRQVEGRDSPSAAARGLLGVVREVLVGRLEEPEVELVVLRGGRRDVGAQDDPVGVVLDEPPGAAWLPAELGDPRRDVDVEVRVGAEHPVDPVEVL